MIVGHTFFGRGMEGVVYDTAIPTDELDEVWLGEGMYDEVFVSVDTSINSTNEKPTGWQLKTIMDAKFNGSLEAGSIDGGGHKVVKLQCYRREYKAVDSDWTLIAQWDYDQDYNTYTITDRFIQNGKTYQYAIVPLAKDIQGDKVMSEPIAAVFKGNFISDLQHNYAMNLNFRFGDLRYNKNTSIQTTLSGQFPIVTQGNQNYRSGTATFLPLTKQQELGLRNSLDTKEELRNRNQIIEFLNNGKIKVIRRDDGDIMAVATNDINLQPLSDSFDELSNVTFSFTEVGKLDYNTMEKSGLIATAGLSNFTYDEHGEIIFDDTNLIKDVNKSRNAQKVLNDI